MLAYLRSRGKFFEVLVVDDGSVDETVGVVERRNDSEVKVTLALAVNRGKGAAVRRGVEESTGDFILITDADLATPIEDLERLEPFARNGHVEWSAARGH